MRLSQWRPAYLAWLQARIQVDSWLLESPEMPGETVALLPPLRDIRYSSQSPAMVEGQAVQELFILQCYPGAVKYKDLPIGDLEGLYQTLALGILMGYQDLGLDLVDLEVLPGPSPIEVREENDTQRAWIVEMALGIQIRFTAEPELGTVITTPFGLQTVGLGLWKEQISTPDWSTRKLDFQITVGSPGVTP